MTQAHTSVGGTPAYISPEQASGDPTDARSDIYSLGILLYELAVGQRPFPIQSTTDALRYHVREPAPRPRSLHSALPASVEQIILRMIEKQPAARFAAAREVAQALRSLPAADLPVHVPPHATAGARPITIVASSNLNAELSALSATPSPSLSAGSPFPSVEIVGANGVARTVAIPGASVTIGRGEQNDIIINDDRISRRHLRLEVQGGTCRVTDLNSSNGTFIGQSKLLPGSPEVWQAGAMLHLGDHHLRLIPPVAMSPGAPLPVAQSVPSAPPFAPESINASTLPPNIGARNNSYGGSTQPYIHETLGPGQTMPAPAAFLPPPAPPLVQPRRGRALYLYLIPLIMALLAGGGYMQLSSGGRSPIPTLIAWISGRGIPPVVEETPTLTPTLEALTLTPETPTPETPSPTPTTPPPPTITPVPVAQGPLPDLTIVEMVIMPRNNRCDGEMALLVVVANMGEVAVGDFVVDMDNARRRVSGGLEPGEEAEVWFTEYSDLNRAIIDPVDGIAESNEANNDMSAGREATVIFTCEPPTDTPSPTPTDTPTVRPTRTHTPTPTPSDTPRPSSNGGGPIVVDPEPDHGNDLMFAYVNGPIADTDIYLYNLATRQRTPLATDSDCDEAEPRWAPDGRRILFQANCNGSYDIYTVDIISGDIERITRTNTFDEWEPSFASDGTWLVYRRTPHDQSRNSDGDLYVLEVATGEAYPLGVRGRAPAWSPVGDEIAFMSDVSGTWQIYLYEVESGEVTRASTNCPNHCRWPVWFTTALTYSASSDDFLAQGIWVRNEGESPFEWLSGDVGRASWSETDVVLFISPEGIETANFDGSNRRVIISGDSNWAPVWNR